VNKQNNNKKSRKCDNRLLLCFHLHITTGTNGLTPLLPLFLFLHPNSFQCLSHLFSMVSLPDDVSPDVTMSLAVYSRLLDTTERLLMEVLVHYKASESVS